MPTLEVDIVRIKRDAYEFRLGPEKVRITGEKIVGGLVRESRAIMTEEILARVYAIPETTYRRTGRLKRGVRSRDFRKGIAAGEIYIDPNILSHNNYFYPVSVEFGLRTHPKYYGRFFWRYGSARVRAMFAAFIAPYVQELRRSLL